MTAKEEKMTTKEEGKENDHKVKANIPKGKREKIWTGNKLVHIWAHHSVDGNQQMQFCSKILGQPLPVAIVKSVLL